MPRVEVTERLVYGFAELNEQQREAALDYVRSHWEILSEDWWEYVVEEWAINAQEVYGFLPQLRGNRSVEFDLGNRTCKWVADVDGAFALRTHGDALRGASLRGYQMLVELEAADRLDISADENECWVEWDAYGFAFSFPAQDEDAQALAKTARTVQVLLSGDCRELNRDLINRLEREHDFCYAEEQLIGMLTDYEFDEQGKPI